MAKETITMTRDLFDEMLIATATKERERIIKLLEDNLYGDSAALIKEDTK